jgi:hypothetical protein
MSLTPWQDRHEDLGRPPEIALRSSSSAILDKSSAVVRNVPFASTSKDFRAALLQRSASSRRRPEQFVTGMGSRSWLVDSGACPDWCKIQVTWFDHLAGQNVARRWSYLTLDGLDRFNKGALMTGGEPSQLKRVRGAQCSCMCVRDQS